MCKFNSRLFVFLVVVSLLILAIKARPATNRSLIDLLTSGNDYDLRYDQRQHGRENVRVKLDGFFIGIPADRSDVNVVTGEVVHELGEQLLFGHGYDSDSDDDESAQQDQSVDSESLQKQLEKYRGAELLKNAESQVTSQRAANEQRSDLKQGSRTKVYLMNLLDFIKQNRHT